MSFWQWLRGLSPEEQVQEIEQELSQIVPQEQVEEIEHEIPEIEQELAGLTIEDALAFIEHEMYRKGTSLFEKLGGYRKYRDPDALQDIIDEIEKLLQLVEKIVAMTDRVVTYLGQESEILRAKSLRRRLLINLTLAKKRMAELIAA